MADASRGHQFVMTPVVLHLRRDARIVAAPLSSDTVAQITWLLHKCRVQINAAIPAGLHAAVAQHMLTHEHECITRACPQARVWLSDLRPSPARYTALPA